MAVSLLRAPGCRAILPPAALLKKGRMVQYAAPEKLPSAPADTFVKKFVGLDGELNRLARLSAVDFLSGEVVHAAPP